MGWSTLLGQEVLGLVLQGGSWCNDGHSLVSLRIFKRSFFAIEIKQTKICLVLLIIFVTNVIAIKDFDLVTGHLLSMCKELSLVS